MYYTYSNMVSVHLIRLLNAIFDSQSIVNMLINHQPADHSFLPQKISLKKGRSKQTLPKTKAITNQRTHAHPQEQKNQSKTMRRTGLACGTVTVV